MRLYRHGLKQILYYAIRRELWWEEVRGHQPALLLLTTQPTSSAVIDLWPSDSRQLVLF